MPSRSGIECSSAAACLSSYWVRSPARWPSGGSILRIDPASASVELPVRSRSVDPYETASIGARLTTAAMLLMLAATVAWGWFSYAAMPDVFVQDWGLLETNTALSLSITISVMALATAAAVLGLKRAAKRHVTRRTLRQQPKTNTCPGHLAQGMLMKCEAPLRLLRRGLVQRRAEGFAQLTNRDVVEQIGLTGVSIDVRLQAERARGQRRRVLSLHRSLSVGPHLEGALVVADFQVVPLARLRPGSRFRAA